MPFLAGSEKCISSATFAFPLGQVLQPLPSIPQQSNITGLVMLKGPSLPLAFITCVLAFVMKPSPPAWDSAVHFWSHETPRAGREP